MKVLSLTVKSLLFGVAALGAMCMQSASASTYGFVNITKNTPSGVDVASQLSMDVSTNGTGAVFKFFNNVGVASSITDIYFDDVVAPGNIFSKIEYSAASDSGVLFDSSAAPGNMPGGNSIGFVANYSGDSKQPIPYMGVNTSTEWVSFLGTFAASKDFSDLIAALDSGSFRVGLHVQAIGTAGKSDSDSFANTTVPLPAAAWLFGSALLGFVSLSNRRKV